MQDKVIVITGASEGIGAVTAEHLAGRGAKVVLAARRPEKLAEVVTRIGGERALAVTTDVTRRADNERLRDQAIERFGRLDVWIANAGRGISRPVAELTDDDVDEMVTINLKSVLYGIQAVLPGFKAQGSGQIIAISSGLSRFPMAPQRSAYSAVKAAVNLLVANLRVELAQQGFAGIHATTVIPGVVATDFGKNSRHGGVDNRQIPGAQPVAEVAEVIASAIERPRAEIYTRPQMLELAARYYAAEDPAEIEAGFVQRR
jgi:NADP-dependent 3-hydroxy acid dehydrogenase YdfG